MNDDNPARAALDAAMDEKTFRHAVQDLLNTRGWRWTYVPDSRQVQGYPGIPDLIAVRDCRLLFIELKTEQGRVRSEQRKWLIDLALTPAEVHLWKPSEWDLIERMLT